MDQRRWMSIVKASSNSSHKKLMASLVSIWNYLESTKGVGKNEPLSVNKGFELVGENV